MEEMFWCVLLLWRLVQWGENLRWLSGERETNFHCRWGEVKDEQKPFSELITIDKRLRVRLFCLLAVAMDHLKRSSPPLCWCVGFGLGGATSLLLTLSNQPTKIFNGRNLSSNRRTFLFKSLRFTSTPNQTKVNLSLWKRRFVSLSLSHRTICKIENEFSSIW